MFYTISRCKPVFISMIFLTLFMIVPVDQGSAAIITTENAVSGSGIRSLILSALAREEVRLALLQHGIDPTEAEGRINALTDEEVLLFADKAHHLRSGGNRNVSKEQKEYNREYNDYILIPMAVLFVVLITLAGIAWLYDHYIRPRATVHLYPQQIEPQPQPTQLEPSDAHEGMVDESVPPYSNDPQ